MHLRSRSFVTLVTLSAVVTLSGCIDRDLRPLVPCTVSGVVNRVKVNAVDSIDLLFAIDNSGSMAQEQAALQAEIPRLVQVLASGDINGNGMEDPGDFDPVNSIHIGVITSDLGVGPGAGFGSEPCDFSRPWGDDGELQLAAANNSCTFPAFLDFDPENDMTSDAVDYISCVGDVGINGCAIEQQLEAMLKAVTPSTSAIRFRHVNDGTVVGETGGQADGVNAGFFREDALLAVIMVTDEDDCSSENTRLFDALNADPNAPFPVPQVMGSVAPELQCATHRGAQFPVSRYVEGLLAVRADPSLVLFATISGVSPELVEQAEMSNDFYGTILDDPSMVEEADVGDPATLRPSCTRPDPADPMDASLTNRAFPPRRLVELARDLEAAEGIGVVTSICNAVDADGGDYNADFGPALDAIIDRIAQALQGACLPRSLTRDGSGGVNCDIIEILPPGMTCADRASAGRVAFDPPRMEPGDDGMLGTADDEEACRVNQVIPTDTSMGASAPTNDTGWFYDDFTTEISDNCPMDRQQRIGFTDDGQPLTGAVIRLECLEPVQPSNDRQDIGTECTPAANTTDDDTCTLSGDDLTSLQSQYDRETAQLRCDRQSNTCQIRCESDAQCPGGYVCFTDESMDTIRDFSFCVNPTCGLN